MAIPSPLPPGQVETREFPRFGLPSFATRFPRERERVQVELRGVGVTPGELGEQLATLPRVEQVADFHCVTTWTRRGLRWGGYRFADFFHRLVAPRIHRPEEATLVVFGAQDGYRASLPLGDALAEDILLADQLEGAPLPLAHGAPLRLVAPAHYGYKSLKHLHFIELRRDDGRYRPMGLRRLVHPRARVAHEERGVGAPGWFLRRLYRPLIGPTCAWFRYTLERHQRQTSGSR